MKERTLDEGEVAKLPSLRIIQFVLKIGHESTQPLGDDLTAIGAVNQLVVVSDGAKKSKPAEGKGLECNRPSVPTSR
jgi:hypothetical protein